MTNPGISTFKDQSKNKSCGKFITKEARRYERKGFGLVFAALQAIAFFCGVPYLARQYWPAVLEWKESYELSYTSFFLMWSLTQHNLVHLICHLGYYVYYRFEIPCIERYKTNYEEPWPWHENPEAWRHQVKNSIAVSFMNSNLITILVYIPLSYSPAFTEHTLSP